MDDLEYKEAHEKFVSGLTGSTFEEIAHLLLIAPLSCLFHRAVTTLLDRSQSRHGTNVMVGKYHGAPREEFTQTQTISLRKFLIDFSTFVMPMLICVIYSDYNNILMVSMLLFSITVGVFNKKFFCIGDSAQIASLFGHVKTFITEYRSSMLLSSFIMILAVDFPIFPRRFAKCETYGISLMDVGQGTFLVANAVTSRLARGVTNQTDSRLQLFLKSLRSIIQLLVIGSARAIAVKSTNYQEHVSEYGVHWNFFFTLACVTIIVSVLNLDIKKLFPVAVAMIVGYQYALLNGLGEYIQDDIKHPRTNLFHANKEGIVSLIGYTVLSLSGSAIGYAVFRPKSRYNDWWAFVGKLVVADVILWAVTLFADSTVEPSSRRMVNFAFVAALVAYNVWLLIFLLLVNLVTKPVENSVVQAANYNGLAMFLLANIGTGLVNMSMRTLHASDGVATAILSLYLLTVCGVGVILYNKKIQLKMW